MLISYDVFDTVVIRKVPNPTDVFIIMEDELGSLWDRNILGSFSNARKKTEFWLRRISHKDISIDDIYRNIQKRTNLSENVIDRIKGIELQKEKDCTLLNILILDEIKQHIVCGTKVVLITDMYWHEEQIRELLCEKDEVFNDIPIYVSCDCGATKASKKLYERVKEQEQVDYSNWIHTGDNIWSDVEVPKKIGIKSILVKGGRRFEFEKNISIRGDILNTYAVIKETIAVSNGEAFDLGASIVAPMVYQYVKWVIDQALSKKIETLYFVLRDGYILKNIADIIIEQNGIDIKTDYIFGSRVAWRFPEITIEKLKNLSIWEKSNWIFRDPAVVYVPLERLGFSNKQVDELFGTEYGKKELYSFAEFKKCLEECLENNNFVSQLEKNISEARQFVDEYIQETINFNESFALVDTNSTGKTQTDLNRVLTRIHPEFKGLRFFYHTYLADADPDEESQFVFINSKEADRRFPEAFFRAPYNQCYGYQKIDGKVVPKFRESDKCAWYYSFDYDSYLKGIIDFSVRIGKTDIDNYVDILLKVVNFDIVSKDEIKQVAQLPFNPDLAGDEILDFYPKINVSALFHPFSKLIYYPKGSYYAAGKAWIALYGLLSHFVEIKRKNSRK